MTRVIHPRLGFIEPQLASPVDQPPEGKHWIHEIKHDGYRAQLVIEEGTALVFHPESDGLLYAGAAFIAIGGKERDKFFAEVDRLTTSWAAFKSTRLLDVKWCRPELAVRVKHLAGSKNLRHATVRGLAC